MSCNQAPILPLAPELPPSSLCVLIPAVAGLRRVESNLGGFHSCAVHRGMEHGRVPSMHLDGMKQEEVGKSNLLGTVVAACPALVQKCRRKLHSTLWIFSFFTFIAADR